MTSCGIMLLTIFYFAATWMQSRKLGSLRKKLVQFASTHSTVVFYKTVLEKNEKENEFFGVSISSPFCKNENKAMVGEVLHYTANTRSCVVIPKQVIDVSNWISFSEEISFPLKVSSKKANLSNDRLFLLIEAYCINGRITSNAHSLNISQFGIPKAWRADNYLGVIVESDLDHLTKISSVFLSLQIIIDSGLEVGRIETVDVEGKPCLLVSEKGNLLKSPSCDSQNCFCKLEAKRFNKDDISTNEWPNDHINLQVSSNLWKKHIELLESFSQCASETAEGSIVTIPENHLASIVPGDSVLQLESAFAEVLEKAVVTKEDKGFKVENSNVNVKSSEANSNLIGSSLSTDFAPESSGDSSAIVSSQSTPSKQDYEARKNTFSSLYSLGSASTLSVRSIGSGKSKPPNIFIYSESSTTIENMKSILSETLHKHKYTVYSITGTQLASSIWAANCYLLVICGNVPQHVEPILTSYLIQGGKLLCLCSSFLHTLLPTFRTAEVRERELVHFSYGRWRRVKLMHHVFCYQNSPSRTKFSGDSDESSNGNRDRVSPVPQTPSSVEVIDNNGISHTLHVQVLGVEETWKTPSLLLAYFKSSGGRAVFSQVHLEWDPSQGNEEEEEDLMHSAISRKEIIKDILSTHLGLEVGSAPSTVTYTVAYFLGTHEAKLKFIQKTKHLLQDGVLKLGAIGLRFCGKGESPPPPTATLLPVLIHSCPKDFSTLEYFGNLGTKSLGRLLIYSEVLGSSMDIVNGELAHGFAVVPSQQTSGKGRTSNQWLSPPGCAMFSIQIHFPTDSHMGRHPSILQHVVSVSIVSSLSELSSEYEKAFDLHLKWPNDVYTNGSIKIGGLIVSCSVGKSNLVCNVGCGINLDNEMPTTCLNKLIEEYNKANSGKLKKLSREKLLACVFTQLEKILDKIDEGNVEYMENLYYKYWLHGGAQVTVVDPSGSFRPVTIMGIDEFGFLKVKERSGNIFTVQPDGNSFDMMEGLIAPKLK